MHLTFTGNSTEVRIGIYLPPQSHLLLKVKDMSQKYTVVTMVTDTHQLLLHIDNFLSKWHIPNGLV